MTNMKHKTLMENLYEKIKFPEAIDWWAAYYAKNKADIAISNARHLDTVRMKLENNAWKKIFSSGNKILDCGCGKGFFSRRIRDVFNGNIEVIGIDISEKIIKTAQEKNPDIQFYVADAEELPVPNNSFNGVIMISTVEQLKNIDPVIKEIHRVLKTNSFFYVCLHKRFIDPFLFPSLVKRGYSFLKRYLSKDGFVVQTQSAGYSAPLKQVRAGLLESLRKYKFTKIEKRSILYQFEWSFYKRLVPFIIPCLIKLGTFLNALPLSYYKNLEYWIYKKI